LVEGVRELTRGRGGAVAYEGVGKDTFTGFLECLDCCGHLVIVGQASGSVPPFEVSRLAARSSSLSRPIIFHYVREAAQREEMAANVFRGLEEGWLKVRQARTFALADAAESHRVIEAAGATVPLVLVPWAAVSWKLAALHGCCLAAWTPTPSPRSVPALREWSGNSDPPACRLAKDCPPPGSRARGGPL
jgi:hypothetical protein